jgi:DNA (cytosine-5)-methyltransferase 1
MAPTKFIDLFAGIGGTRLAFEAASMVCVFSSEWDQHSQRTYEANFGHKPAGDITEISVDSIPDFEVLVAGFPCQPFSSIGRRQGFEHPTQGTLFHEIVRIVAGKTNTGHMPKALLLENVKGLLNHDGGRTWKTIQESLDELGYDVFPHLLNSADFGVPQFRERIYIICLQKNSLASQYFSYWVPTKSKKHVGIGSFVESNVSDRSISTKLQKSYIFKIDDGRPEIVSPNSDKPVKTLVASYHKIQRLTGTFVSDGPTGLRLLTENECKAIMGFPKDFKVPVSRTQMYRQFGNSVAVPVVTEIAKAIAKALEA